MQFQGAVITEQGVTFGILIVQQHVLNDPTRRDGLVLQASRLFDGIPTVLMTQDFNGTPTYYGLFAFQVGVRVSSSAQLGLPA